MVRRLTLMVTLCLALAFSVGCAQNTETTSEQGVETTLPVRTQQDQATQGSQVNIYVQNAPGEKAAGTAPSVSVGGDGEVKAVVDDLKNEAGGNSAGKVDATYAQSGVTINVNTGSTTPSATGSASATGTSTGTTSQSVTPTLEVRAGISVPIGFAMPGGVVDQTVAALGGEGSSATLTPANKFDLENAWLRATETGDMSDFYRLVREFFDIPATTQPSE